MRLVAMEYFIRIADSKSLSKVSRKYAIPQQSLSSMILAMETEMYVELFFRQGKEMRLTEEGQLFYNYCSNFFMEFQALQKELYPHKFGLARQKVVVSTQNNIAQTLIPKWFSTVMKYYPEIELEVKIQNGVEIIQDILSDESQIGFILLFEKDGYTYPGLSNEIEFYPLFFSRPYFWVNQKYPLACHKSIGMKQLEPYKIIKDQIGDPELFDFIFNKYFKLSPQFIKTANRHISTQMVQDNVAICPDLKVEKGELALTTAFNHMDNVIALPLSVKDNYKVVTGYIMKKEKKEQKMLNNITELLN